MSVLQPPKSAKLIAAVFAADKEDIALAAARLADLAGPLDYAGPTFVFNQTDYYREEMGWPLYKRFFSAVRLIDPVQLVTIKIQCMAMEDEFSSDGKRRFNIDPGYITAERLVLSTGKNAAHRLYLGEGVYGDVHLIYQHGRFKPLPWTYPDYASRSTMTAMNDIRKRYLDQLKTGEEI